MSVRRIVTPLPLSRAETIVDQALAAGREAGLAPLTVVVLDSGGHSVALKREDGSGIARVEVATGKAWAALGVGLSSRALGEANKDRPVFLNALAAASQGRCVPVPGGVLICNDAGEALGAVGVSGDTSDNDERCAAAGVRAAGLSPEPAGQ